MVSQLIFASKLSELEVKIYCNTIKTNVPKWRKTCTGLKFDWLHFYGPQSHILLLDHFEGPCIKIFSTSLRAEQCSAWLCPVCSSMGWRGWGGDVTLSKCTDRFQTGAAIITSIHSFVQTLDTSPAISPPALLGRAFSLSYQSLKGKFQRLRSFLYAGTSRLFNLITISCFLLLWGTPLPPPWSPVTKRELFLYCHQSRAGVWTLCLEHK